MRDMKDMNLYEKLVSSERIEINPREVSDQINDYFKSKDYDKVRYLRDCYVTGFARQCPNSPVENIRNSADRQVLLHAGFADLVNREHYVPEGMLQHCDKRDKGPIAKFVKKALKPSYKNRESHYLFW